MKNKSLHRASNTRFAATFLAAACGFAVLALAGCGGGSDDGEGTVAPSSLPYAQRCGLAPAASGALELPAPTGGHCIGKTVFHLTDPARDEPFTPDDTSDRRELSVKAWYPVGPAGAAGRRADYLEPAIVAEAKASLSIDPAAPDVATNAIAGGMPPVGARYPVVLFSPGYGGVAEGYSTLIEDLASHGVIVLAIDHPYVSGITALASGQKVETLMPDDLQQAQAVLQLAARTLVDDQRWVLDWLRGEGTGVLRGLMDLARIGAYGHSIGGSTALQVSRQDARVKAALNMDGSVQGDTAGPWARPLKIILATDHGHDATIDATLRAAAGMASVSTIPQTGHMDFSDLKLLLGFYVPAAAGKQPGLGAADALEVIRATRAQVSAFFEQWVMR